MLNFYHIYKRKKKKRCIILLCLHGSNKLLCNSINEARSQLLYNPTLWGFWKNTTS